MAMKRKESLQKVQDIDTRYTLPWLTDRIENNGEKVREKFEEIKKDAEEQLNSGEVKGQVVSPWYAHGSYCGWANFLTQTALIENDIGVIVNSFSGFNSSLVNINCLLKRGFKNFEEVRKTGKERDIARAKTIALFFETFQGKYDGTLKEQILQVTVGYKSVTDSGLKESGYKVVNIDPIKGQEVLNRILGLDVRKASLEELREACLDMAAFSRQAGENTIDTRKKPVLIVIVGIPRLDVLKNNVSYMGKQDTEFKICWDEKGVSTYDGQPLSVERGIRLLLNGFDVVQEVDLGAGLTKVVTDSLGRPNQCYLQDKRLGGKYFNSYQEKIVLRGGVKRMKLHMCDTPQVVWRILAGQFVPWLKDIAVRFNGDDIQKMFGDELKRIRKVGKKYQSYKFSQNKVFNFKTEEVIEDLKEELQTAFNASAAEQKRLEDNGSVEGLSKDLIGDQVDNEKRDLAEIVLRLQNKTRVMFDTLERVMSQTTKTKIVISPADRIRLIWNMVLKEHDGQINWKQVSSLPQTLLEPEYLLWVLDAFKGKAKINGKEVDFDTLIPKFTRDKLRLEGTFRDMSPEEVQRLDGYKLPFNNGEFVFEGETKLSCDEPLTGTFDIKVEEDGSIFATHDIASLVVVPEADHKQVIVKLTSGDNQEIQSITKASMDADEIWLIKGSKGGGNAIVIPNEDGSVNTVGTYLLNDAAVATQMLNIKYGDKKKNGLKGTVSFYKPIEYQSSEKQLRSTAFLAIDITGEISADERRRAGFTD